MEAVLTGIGTALTDWGLMALLPVGFVIGGVIAVAATIGKKGR